MITLTTSTCRLCDHEYQVVQSPADDRERFCSRGCELEYHEIELGADVEITASDLAQLARERETRRTSRTMHCASCGRQSAATEPMPRLCPDCESPRLAVVASVAFEARA